MFLYFFKNLIHPIEHYKIKNLKLINISESFPRYKVARMDQILWMHHPPNLLLLSNDNIILKKNATGIHINSNVLGT